MNPKSEEIVPSQGSVLTLLENNKKWMTSEDVCKELNIECRDRAARFLRKLWKYDFLIRRKKNKSVELEYKIND